MEGVTSSGWPLPHPLWNPLLPEVWWQALFLPRLTCSMRTSSWPIIWAVPYDQSQNQSQPGFSHQPYIRHSTAFLFLFLSYSKLQQNKREYTENKFWHLVFYLKKRKKQGGIPQPKSPTIKQLPCFWIFQINTWDSSQSISLYSLQWDQKHSEPTINLNKSA